MYDEEALIRLDFVRTLRDAGVGIETIKKVVRHDLPLAEALRLHLADVEAHVASLQCVAAALRAALRGDPDESDVRRLCAVTRLTGDERRAVVERFHARIVEGQVVDDAWRRKMMAEGTPRLPDNPTPAQLDAWVELAELLADPTFVETLRASAKQMRDRKIDVDALRVANEEVAAAAAALQARRAAGCAVGPCVVLTLEPGPQRGVQALQRVRSRGKFVQELVPDGAMPALDGALGFGVAGLGVDQLDPEVGADHLERVGDVGRAEVDVVRPRRAEAGDRREQDVLVGERALVGAEAAADDGAGRGVEDREQVGLARAAVLAARVGAVHRVADPQVARVLGQEGAPRSRRFIFPWKTQTHSGER